MLDLNVDILSGYSLCGEKEDAVMEVEMLLQGSGNQMEDSGTSTSSVVNAEEAPNNVRDDSSNNSSEFIFDILRKENHGVRSGNAFKDQSPAPELVTRSLFPVTGERGDGESEFGSGLSSRPQWLNLSFAHDSGGHELRISQQKQQQVRKSRRGPRSRSSQYRGVTFYRRTGRWESHIWY